MMSKLDIWIRNEKCEIVNRRGHLHVYNCHGTPIIDTLWFDNGHVEVTVPPGCYKITAGVVYGNQYTDMTIVIVKCGEEACINLVLNKFREEQAMEPRRILLPLFARGCGARIVAPLIANAAKVDINRKDIERAVNVIAKAANIDESQIRDGIKAEIDGIRKNIKDPDDETMEYVKLLEEYLL